MSEKLNKGFWYRLPEYTLNIKKKQQKLDIVNVVVGRLKYYVTEVTIGNSLVIGQKYRVDLQVGDDFSNVGYVNSQNYFIATATTPTTWNTSGVYLVTEDVQIFHNNVDTNLTISAISASELDINITNNLFVVNKTYPEQQGAQQSPQVINNNKIRFTTTEGTSPSIEYTYFKVEVYK